MQVDSLPSEPSKKPECRVHQILEDFGRWDLRSHLPTIKTGFYPWVAFKAEPRWLEERCPTKVSPPQHTSVPAATDAFCRLITRGPRTHAHMN